MTQKQARPTARKEIAYKSRELSTLFPLKPSGLVSLPMSAYDHCVRKPQPEIKPYDSCGCLELWQRKPRGENHIIIEEIVRQITLHVDFSEGSQLTLQTQKNT